MALELVHLERFVRAVHRRMMWVRAAEQVGTCVLGGCAAAIVLLPILLWRGQPTQSLTTGIFGLSLLAGVIWVIVSRRGVLSTVAQADRQLGWSDLLTTSWMLRGEEKKGREPFISSVLACAEARCAATPVSAVVLNRLGRRAWSGIALAVLFAGTLSLLGADGRQSQAAASQTTRSWLDGDESSPDGALNVTRIARLPDTRRATPGLGTDETDPLRSPTNSGDSPKVAGTTGGAGASNTGVSENAAGGGAAQSNVANNTGTPANPIAGGAGQKAGMNGRTSSGGGGVADDGVDGSAGGAAGNASGKPAVPPWRSTGWAADQQAAQEAMRSGRVPDAYRALVRDYFEGR